MQQLESENLDLRRRLNDLKRMDVNTVKKEVMTRVAKVSEERNLVDTMGFIASKKPTKLSLPQIIKFCGTDAYRTHLFLHRELPIRTAIAIEQLSEMPHGFATMSSTKQVRSWLLNEFKDLTAAEKPETPTTEQAFTNLMKKIQSKHQEVILTLGRGLWEMKKDIIHKKVKVRDDKQEWGKVTEAITEEFPNLQSQLDNFYAGRIAAAFLVKQHKAVVANAKRPKPRPGYEHYAGIVCARTDLFDVCKSAVIEAKAICFSHYDNCPEVILRRGHPTEQQVFFPHIPSHVHYIVFEILKNSLKASIDVHAKKKFNGGIDCSKVPPIEVVVCDSENLEDVSIRVSDCGGGIALTDMKKVMSYMYTTASVNQFDTHNISEKTPLAGYGFGLPISRLYARHFGGDLKLRSIEGYGTDAFLHLGTSLNSCVSTFEHDVEQQRIEKQKHIKKEFISPKYWKISRDVIHQYDATDDRQFGFSPL